MYTALFKIQQTTPVVTGIILQMSVRVVPRLSCSVPGGSGTRAGPPGLTALRRQQPRQRGRGGPGVHVTKAAPRVPPRSTRAPGQLGPPGSAGREPGRWTTGNPRKAPCLTPSPVLLGGQLGAQRGAAAASRFSDSAQPRRPGFPPAALPASHPQTGR